MLFGEGPQIKNIAADLNKLFRQGSLLNQSGQTVEGDSTADQGTSDLLAARDPVIQEISVGMSGEQSARYTVSGTPPISLPNSMGKPLKAWAVDLLLYQEGTGDPAPDNVRPIHGTDKLTITTAGKNLCGINEAYGPVSAITITDGVATGTAMAFNGRYIYIPQLLVGNTLTLSAKITAPATVTRVFARANVNGSNIDGNDIMPGTTGVTTVSFTPTSTSDYFSLSYGSGSGTLTVSDFQLELGSTATPYTPFLAPSQTVLTLPQTVYTGTIGSEGGESESGELIVDGVNAYIETSGNYCNVKPYGIEASPIVQGGWRCSTFPTNTAYMGYNVTYKFIYFNKNAFSAIGETDEEINAYCQAHPIQIVYRKAAPESIALSAPTIPTPTGTATTWATAEDGTADSMEVTYIGKA